MKQIIKYLQQFKQWVLLVVKCHFFLHKQYFHFTPFVYLNKDNNVVKGEISDKIKWLDKDYLIKDYCYEKAMKTAQDKVSKIYDGDLDAVW